MRYVLVYDISADKRRNKVAKLLLDYGDRVQYSVFEADLAKDDLERVCQRASKVINPVEDSVRIYALCDACVQRIVTIGLDCSTEVPKGWKLID